MGIGRTLIMFGVLLVVAGVGFLLAGRFGVHRLPGDIEIRRGGFTLFLPIMSSILVSVVLTILLNVFFRRR